MNNLIEKIEKEIRGYFDRKGSHDITHTKRVLSAALKIAKFENNVDLEVLKAACLMHDIARKKEDSGKCKDHSDKGADMAEPILKKIGFPKNKIEGVLYCIRVHRKSKRIKPVTIEAKILQDADRIDIFGAIGIARTFAHLGNKDKMVIHSSNSRRLTYFEDVDSDSILEYLRSLLFASPRKFNVKGTWKIVKPRLDFIKKFIVEFEKEWK